MSHAYPSVPVHDQSYKELLRRAVLGLLRPLISTVAELWLPTDPRFSPALPGKVLMGKECHGCFSGIFYWDERIRPSGLMCKLQDTAFVSVRLWLQFLWLEVSPLCQAHTSGKVRGGSKANQLEGWTLGESECVSQAGEIFFFTFIFQQILLLFQFLRLRPRPFYTSLQSTVDTALWQRPW